MINFRNDSRIILTLDTGGTNMVFGAMQRGEFIVEPLVLDAHADNLEKCLDRRTTEVLRRLRNIRIYLLQLRQNIQNNVGQTERNVRDEKRPKSENTADIEYCTDENEKQHHRHTGYDFGIHHRNIGHGGEYGFAESLFHFINSYRRNRSQ